MENEKTMKIVANLDRSGIEGLLAQVRGQAQSKNFAELASLFDGVEGMARAQLDQKVTNALKWLADKPEHASLAAQLEMAELNLRNI